MEVLGVSGEDPVIFIRASGFPVSSTLFLQGLQPLVPFSMSFFKGCFDKDSKQFPFCC